MYLMHTLITIQLFSWGMPQSRPERPAGPPDTSPFLERYSSSIFLVHAGQRTGTGFLIAKEPPLIATSAHVVADCRVEDVGVYRNEDRTRHAVQRLIVHAHARERAGGPVRNPGPDVAVIELSALPLDAGPPLHLASPTAAGAIRGKPIAAIGFPFYAVTNPAEDPPQAVVATGLAGRLLDFQRTSRLPVDRRWLIEHDARTVSGFSGAPVFLITTGEVAAIVQGFRDFSHQTTSEELRIPHAVRVDALWELLLDLTLADSATGTPAGLTRLHEPGTVAPVLPDPAATHLRTAASRLAAGDYRSACEAANAAIALAPRSDEAFGQRAGTLHAYGIHLADHARRPAEATRFHRLALEDYERAVAYAVEAPRKLRWQLARGITECSLASHAEDRTTLERALAFARGVLKEEHPPSLHHQAWEVAG